MDLGATHKNKNRNKNKVSGLTVKTKPFDRGDGGQTGAISTSMANRFSRCHSKSGAPALEKRAGFRGGTACSS